MPAGNHERLNRLCRWVTGGVLAAALALPSLTSFAGPLTAVRVWPGPDYTRLTLESPQVIGYKLFAGHRPLLSEPRSSAESISPRTIRRKRSRASFVAPSEW